MSILPVERKMTILEELNVHGKVNAADLARLFDVTTETIRRDLGLLENDGRRETVIMKSRFSSAFAVHSRYIFWDYSFWYSC